MTGSTTSTGFFDRQAAATYARTYGAAPNPAYRQIKGTDCTNFVSQALLKKVSFKTDEIVYWKLKDMISAAPGFVAGPAPGGVKRGLI